MIVVSDTSPLNYLILIGKIGVLPDLLGEVIIPRAVFLELKAEQTPGAVKKWVSSTPEWLTIREDSLVSDIRLGHLGAGEREAIQLA